MTDHQRPIVSLCFSGQPRVMLNYKKEWRAYFDLIRSKYELRVFFHGWTEQGLVRHDGVHYVEGRYEESRYKHFDELIEFLNPNAFQFHTPDDIYCAQFESLADIFMSSTQAHPRAILSQIHSVWLSNCIRQDYERNHGPSNIVVKLRFDLVPHIMSLIEIDYVAMNPLYPVLFAPTPGMHLHPGGGGGCLQCLTFLDRHLHDTDCLAEIKTFLSTHQMHANDICDLFAIAAPAVMDHYCNMFPEITDIYSKIKLSLSKNLHDYILEIPFPEPQVKRIFDVKSKTWDIEASPIFVPEKFIRFNLSGYLVVHQESVFRVARR